MKSLKINFNVSWLRVCVTAILIIGIFCIVVFLLINVPWLIEGNKARQKAYYQRTEWMIHCFQEAIQKYTKDCGAPPNELQWLMINPGAAGWAGPYIKINPVFYWLHRYDAWGTPYRYELIDGKPVIISAGHDKVFGTKDDIVMHGIKPKKGKE